MAAVGGAVSAAVGGAVSATDGVRVIRVGDSVVSGTVAGVGDGVDEVVGELVSSGTIPVDGDAVDSAACLGFFFSSVSRVGSFP